MTLDTLLQPELSGELPSAAERVLREAEKNGWKLNGQGVTLCIRLDHPEHPSAVPFYVTWQLQVNPETGEPILTEKKGERSWRFVRAGTATLQPLNSKDVFLTLADPERVWPEFAFEEETSD